MTEPSWPDLEVPAGSGRALPPSNWPETVEEAVEYLLRALDPEVLDLVASLARDELSRLYRPGLTMWIRHDFGLWQGSKPLLASAVGLGRRPGLRYPSWGDPEDASMTVVEAPWLRLRGDRSDT